RRRVTFEATPGLAIAKQLLVADRAGSTVHRIEQWRRVPFAEDQMVVMRVIRRGEVVAQVLRQQHGHQVGGGHRGSRVPGSGCGTASYGIDAQLLTNRAPELVVAH